MTPGLHMHSPGWSMEKGQGPAKVEDPWFISQWTKELLYTHIQYMFFWFHSFKHASYQPQPQCAPFCLLTPWSPPSMYSTCTHMHTHSHKRTDNTWRVPDWLKFPGTHSNNMLLVKGQDLKSPAHESGHHARGWRINPTDAVSPWGSGKLCNKHVQGQHHDNLTFFLFPPYIKGHQCGFSSFNPHQSSGFSCTSSWVPTQQGSPSFIPTVFPML